MKHVDRTILGGMLWVAFFALLGRLVGAAKEMAVAWRFGASAELDGYLFVFNLVCLPAAIWFSVLSAVLVPMLTGWSQRRTDSLQRFGFELLALTVLLGIAGGLLVKLGVPWLVGLRAVGLGIEAANAALNVAPALSWVVPAGMAAALGSIWLLAESRHTNTLFEAVPALVILLFALLASRDVAALAFATSAGFAVHCVVVSWAVRALGRTSTRVQEVAGGHWRRFRSGFGTMIIAQALMTSTSFLDQFFAARLDAGSIAIMGYANRFASLALGICAIAISRSMLPILSSLQREVPQSRETVDRWTRMTMTGGLVAAGIGFATSEPLIRLLLERGAFTPENTRHVARTLDLLLLQLPAYCGGVVLASWASATRRLGLILAASVVGFLVKVTAASVLVERYGLDGIATSTALMYVGTLLVMCWGYLRANRPAQQDMISR